MMRIQLEQQHHQAQHFQIAKVHWKWGHIWWEQVRTDNWNDQLQKKYPSSNIRRAWQQRESTSCEWLSELLNLPNLYKTSLDFNQFQYEMFQNCFFCQSTKSHPQIATSCWQISEWWRQGHWQSVPLVPLRAAPRRVVPVVDALKIGEKDRKSAGLNFWFAIFRPDIFDMSVLMLIWFNMLMCFFFSEVLWCIFVFLFRLCPPPVLYQDDADPKPISKELACVRFFRCLSMPFSTDSRTICGCFWCLFRILCWNQMLRLETCFNSLVSCQGTTMDWAASADQIGTSSANQCLSEKLWIDACKSTILFERLHSNFKIGWPSKPRNYCTGRVTPYT